jgi:hypothetical protein
MVIFQSHFAFELYARRHPKRTLQAGEYFFDHPMRLQPDALWFRFRMSIAALSFVNEAKQFLGDLTDLWDTIERIAKHLNMPSQEFTERYLEPDREETLLFKMRQQPCPFLGDDNRCTLDAVADIGIDKASIALGCHPETMKKHYIRKEALAIFARCSR